MKKILIIILFLWSCADAQVDRKKKEFLMMQSGSSAPKTFNQKIDSYRTRDNGVFIFNYSNTKKLFRIFTPFNDKWAQFWTLAKETSAGSDYYEFSGEQGVSEYFEIKSPTDKTGTWTSFGVSPSSFASVVGSTISFSFTGTGFNIRSYTDNRGGIWQFVIKDVGLNVVATIDVSVYNSSAAKINTNVIDTLDYGAYTVIGTFTGDDPDNVPSGGAGTSRGWLSTAYSDVGTIVYYDKPVWVVGSPTPNFCYPPEAEPINSAIDYYKYSISSHREYAFASRLDGSSTTLSDGWVPLHGIMGNATIFSNLATDRVLQFDASGTNLITSLSDIYSLGITGTELSLYQKFIGYNRNGSSTDHLFEITQTWTWTNAGMKLNSKIEAIADLDPLGNTSYTALFDAPLKASKEGFEFIIMDNGDELTTIGSLSEVLYDKTQLQNNIWGGGQIAINKTGTDFEKSVVQSMVIKDFSSLMRYSSNYNQEVLTWRDGTRRKNYPTVVLNGAVLTGEVWEWEANWVMGVVPDAYNVLK